MTARDEPWPEGTPCWAEIRVDDPPRVAEFYANLLGWRLTDHGPEYDHYLTARRLGRAVADVGPRAADDPAHPRWLVCLAADDVEASTWRAVNAGGTVVVPPAAVGTHGRFSVVADRVGARVGLWEPGRYIGAEVYGEPGAIVGYEYLGAEGRDATGDAAAFYAEAFGLGLGRPAPDGSVPMKVGGRVVATASPGGAGAGWRVAFGVDDVDVAAREVERTGGRVVRDGRPAPGDDAVLVVDVAGAAFVLRLPSGGCGTRSLAVTEHIPRADTVRTT